MPTEDSLSTPDRLILFDKYDMDDKWKMHGNIYYGELRSFGSIWSTWKEYNKFIQLK